MLNICKTLIPIHTFLSKRALFNFKYSQDAMPITVGRSLTSSFSTICPMTLEIPEVAPSVINHTPIEEPIKTLLQFIQSKHSHTV